jgi:hypothetical protein
MDTYNKIFELVQSMQAEADKFFGKGNKAAGTRLRAQCQDLKELSQVLRIEVQNAKKSE